MFFVQKYYFVTLKSQCYGTMYLNYNELREKLEYIKEN